MKSYEMDLSTGSLWKKALIFSVPLMFSNILQVLFNMSDIAVVGKFSGPIALGAVVPLYIQNVFCFSQPPLSLEYA